MNYISVKLFEKGERTHYKFNVFWPRVSQDRLGSRVRMCACVCVRVPVCARVFGSVVCEFEAHQDVGDSKVTV